MYFYNRHSMKTKILSMLGTGYFLKIAKINSQQEKPISPNRKNQFPQNTKNRQSVKINCKNFVPYGNSVINNVSQTIYVFCSSINGTQLIRLPRLIINTPYAGIKFYDHRHQSLQKPAVVEGLFWQSGTRFSGRFYCREV